MKKILLFSFLFPSFVLACDFEGAMVLVMEKGVLTIGKCIPGSEELGVIDYEDMIKIVDANKNDPQFFADLKAISAGTDYNSVMKLIKNLATANPGKGIQLYSERPGTADLEVMKRILDKLNGTAYNNFKAVPTSESIDQLLARLAPLAKENEKIRQSLPFSGRCGDSSPKVEPFRINYEDGMKNGFVPVEIKELSANVLEVSFYGLGPGEEGQLVSRNVKVENGRLVWVGSDGTEYPVNSIERIPRAQALAATVPDNSCVWERIFGRQKGISPGPRSSNGTDGG